MRVSDKIDMQMALLQQTDWAWPLQKGLRGMKTQRTSRRTHSLSHPRQSQACLHVTEVISNKHISQLQCVVVDSSMLDDRDRKRERKGGERERARAKKREGRKRERERERERERGGGGEGGR